jgi:hypothetical protein
MLKKGAAKKATIYVNEDAKYHMTSLHDAILQYLLHKGVRFRTSSPDAHHKIVTSDVEMIRFS